jgi:uncharacterized membrane protein
MTPLLIAGAAVLLGEFPSLLGIIGIALITLGTYVHAQEDAKSWQDYLRPFKLLRLPADFDLLSEEEQQLARFKRKALLLSYISAAFGTIGLIGDGLTARSGNISLGWAIQLLVLSFFFATVVPSASATAAGSFKERLRAHRVKFVGMGVAFGLHYLFTSAAFRLAPVAYVGSLKRLTIVMTVLVAWVYLGEKKAPRRLIPTIIVTVGAILLFFDPAAKKIVDAARTFLE